MHIKSGKLLKLLWQSYLFCQRSPMLTPMIKILILVAFTGLLIGCRAKDYTPSLTPMPESARDLCDEILTQSITTFLQSRGAPISSQYDFIRADLNGDNKREGLVMMKLPHSYWCGWAGCPMFIFTPRLGDFMMMSEIQNVRGPIFIAPKSDGNKQQWRNIIARASGGNTPDRTVVLSYSPHGYTSNTLNAPEFSGSVYTKPHDKVFR